MLHTYYQALQLEGQRRRDDQGRVQRALLDRQRQAGTRPSRLSVGWAGRVLSAIRAAGIAPKRAVARRSST
jgi:hypothetical protein